MRILTLGTTSTEEYAVVLELTPADRKALRGKRADVLQLAATRGALRFVEFDGGEHERAGTVRYFDWAEGTGLHALLSEALHEELEDRGWCVLAADRNLDELGTDERPFEPDSVAVDREGTFQWRSRADAGDETAVVSRWVDLASSSSLFNEEG